MARLSAICCSWREWATVFLIGKSKSIKSSKLIKNGETFPNKTNFRTWKFYSRGFGGTEFLDNLFHKNVRQREIIIYVLCMWWKLYAAASIPIKCTKFEFCGWQLSSVCHFCAVISSWKIFNKFLRFFFHYFNYVWVHFWALG